MSRSWSPAPQDVSNEDEECFHIEASEAPLKIGINAAAPPASRVTAADGLHLHLNSRAKSGYTRVESLPDGRFRVAVDNAAQIACLRTACIEYMHMNMNVWVLHAQGLDAEHSEVPLGIYSTALEAATVYARHARMRVPQVALAITGRGRCGAAVCSCKGSQPNDTMFSQVKKRDEQRLAGYTYRQEGLIQAEPRAKKARLKRSSEAAPEASAEEGWVASAADLEGSAVTAVTAEDAEEDAAGEAEQLCVVESIEVIHHASAILHLRG